MLVDDMFVAYTDEGWEGARVLVKLPEGSTGFMLTIVHPDGRELSAILHHPWHSMFMAAVGACVHRC